ncbi:MAG: hypothetical protein ACLFUE_05460 [Desulfobacteraceae bacterium]
MDFKAHIETAWKLTIRHIAALIIMTLVLYLGGLITLGILTPVLMAGYMHAALLLVREGREPRVQDVFSHMRLFLPLLAFSVAAVIIIIVGFTLLILPGILVTVAIAFCCLYVLPLMTDRGLGVIDAVKESFRMSFHKNTVDQIVVVLIFLGITAVGVSTYIGWLFTQPLATVFLVSVYDQKVRGDSREPAPTTE